MKRKAIDTKPLVEPLAMWDALTVQEKHDVAAEMIAVVYISHNSEDIEIKFAFEYAVKLVFYSFCKVREKQNQAIDHPEAVC